jgi:hypothetical protein
MKTLVVYFSRDGHTKKVAEKLSEKLGADVEAIREKANRKGIVGWIKSGAESARGKIPDIDPLSLDISSYGLVVVGTPVWASTLASPVRSFLLNNKDSIKEAAFFCTMGGGEGKTFDEMRELYGKQPKAVSSYKSSLIDNDEYLAELDAFIEKLG